MRHLHHGVFEATVPLAQPAVPDYRLEVGYATASRSCRTTPTGTCRRSASWTCT